MPTKETEQIKEPAAKSEETQKMRGRYIETIGRRKTALARVRLYKKGEGVIMVNDQKAGEYFLTDHTNLLKQPLKATEHLRDLNLSIVTRGGGKKSQAEAARHGIARALVELDEAYKASVKTKGWLTRDSRRKERKKPGLKKARRAPQWAKR